MSRSNIEIREVDPADDADLARWCALMQAAEDADRGEFATAWQRDEMAAMLRCPRALRRTELYLGYVAGEPVAAGELRYPLLDNLTSVELQLWVLPTHRRRGHGSTMLTAMETIVLAAGRNRFDVAVDWAYDEATKHGEGVPGIAFGLAHGYGLGLIDVQREAPLPIDEALLERMAAETAPYADGYEFRTWVGPFPDDDAMLLSYLQLSSRLLTEAPMGDNDYEDEAVDLTAFRQEEAMLIAGRRTAVHTLALAPDGSVAAYTDLMISGADPARVYQYGTLVDGAHRGHRLGLAVKLANHLALQRSGLADGRRLITWNAEDNTHMIAINDQLGFVPVGRSGELQKKV